MSAPSGSVDPSEIDTTLRLSDFDDAKVQSSVWDAWKGINEGDFKGGQFSEHMSHITEGFKTKVRTRARLSQGKDFTFDIGDKSHQKVFWDALNDLRQDENIMGMFSYTTKKPFLGIAAVASMSLKSRAAPILRRVKDEVIKERQKTATSFAKLTDVLSKVFQVDNILDHLENSARSDMETRATEIWTQYVKDHRTLSQHLPSQTDRERSVRKEMAVARPARWLMESWTSTGLAKNTFFDAVKSLEAAEESYMSLAAAAARTQGTDNKDTEITQEDRSEAKRWIELANAIDPTKDGSQLGFNASTMVSGR